MKAMIFAAGLGTRLKPLTQHTPKALVSLHGKPLLQHQIEKLVRAGFTEIVVNVHHFADHVKEFIQQSKLNVRLEISDETNALLDTGGGIKKASWFFDDNNPFLVHNVDVLTNLDLALMMDDHKRSGSLATLAVRNRSTSRYLLFDRDRNLSGWMNTQSNEKILVRNRPDLQELAFSGVHIIQPEIFKWMSETGRFSIINAYLRLAEKHSIKAFPHDDSFWKDVGKPSDLEEAGKNPGMYL